MPIPTKVVLECGHEYLVQLPVNVVVRKSYQCGQCHQNSNHQMVKLNGD